MGQDLPVGCLDSGVGLIDANLPDQVCHRINKGLRARSRRRCVGDGGHHGKLSKRGFGIGQAGLQDMGQGQRIGLAMGDAIPGTQLMGYRVHVPHADLIDGDTGMIRRDRHPLPGLDILRMTHSALEPTENALYRKAAVLLPRAAIPDTDISLDTVRERVNTGRCCHCGG